MDLTEQPARRTQRPILVAVAVLYCFFIAFKIAYWLVTEGWESAWFGDFPIYQLFPVVMIFILLMVGSVLLWARSKKSSGYLLVALFFGVFLAPVMMPEIFYRHSGMFNRVIYVLPSAGQALLLVVVWVYSLRLRRSDYFNVVQNNR
ncbi:hypothetical protein [Pseudomonas sp. Irchel 3A5]|uniref:hypothetical protein n=1 Tax=Pseudomonas sp. Irchel 3A5 TaxID=2008911 RepID=UPI000BA2E734|nr:hypothetical protein [Pseudomonas sp. Irchel 3A5]